jgi:hypothetical protein
MSHPCWPAAACALAILAGAALADNLPPAPSELGQIRRNEQGRLEVARPPVIPPPETTLIPDAAAAGKAGGQRQADDRKPAPAATSGRTLVVGPHEALRSIGEAARLARDGDTVEIRSGEYRQQAVVWPQGRLTIRGVGQRPLLLADGASAEGKALWLVRNGQVSIENLEFRGTRSAAGNGVGIRFERGHLRVVRCAFFDNESAIVTGDSSEAVLEVEDSTFGAAPRHAAALHPRLAAGTIARLSVRGSHFEQGSHGPRIRSRARASLILYNLIVEGAGAGASSLLDFPQGGVAWVIGNVIGRQATTADGELIAYGAEGGHPGADHALYLAHNTLLDDAPGGRFLRVWSERLPPATEVWTINNLLVGDGVFASQGRGRHAGNEVVERSLLVGPPGLAFALPQSSPLRGQAQTPGFAREHSLTPTAEFRLPAGTVALSAGKPLSPGARQ